MLRKPPMFWMLAAASAAVMWALSSPALAQKGCKPTQYQLCLDLPPADRLQDLDVSKTTQSQRFDQLKPAAPMPDPAHNGRMKLDDNTSVGIGRGGVGIKRSF